MTRASLLFFAGFFLMSIPGFSMHWEYKGDFAAASASASPCDQVFAIKEYDTKHFLTGPTGYTSVLYFSNPGTNGFLHGLSFVGLMGGSGDIKAEKKLQKDGYYYTVVSEGIVDKKVIVVQVTAEARKTPSGLVACVAKAEYTGFAQ